jgi:hypothetical protein
MYFLQIFTKKLNIIPKKKIMIFKEFFKENYWNISRIKHLNKWLEGGGCGSF